jgi:hypothetical protein
LLDQNLFPHLRLLFLGKVLMKNKYFLKAKTEIRIQIVNLILKAMCLQMKVITTICQLFLKQIQKNMKKFNKKIKIFLVWQIPIANKIIK